MIEPILDPSLDRFCLHPIKYQATYDLYKKQVASFWSVDEVDLSDDELHWETLTQDERNWVLHVLSFFHASDGIVNENLTTHVVNKVQIPEARQFYGFQIGMETIHTDMYGLLLTTYEKNPEKRQELAKAIHFEGSIKRKADWALKWVENDEVSFAHRLIAFACVEGIMFSASFCAIYFFKKKGKLPGLTFSNELIARDESMHRDFAVHMYSFLNNKLEESVVQDIVKDAVECENHYVQEGLNVNIIGMKASMMQQYVQFVADHLLVSLGYSKVYNAINPFEWMDLISMEGKTNFFEKRVGEYAKANAYGRDDFSLDADF
jgi:ribonucleotide reductase beta subunit family protein with ferritin-like domain